MNFAIIIQARLGSTRLPGKILKQFRGYSILSVLIGRLKKSKKVKNIIIATTKNKIDTKLINFCKNYSLIYFRGSENDVLKRYYDTAKKFNVKNIIRITSDCPLIDIKILDNMVKVYLSKKLDYYSNTYPEPSTYPDGMDIEIFSFKSLNLANKLALKKSDREHVTPFFRRYKKFNISRKDFYKDVSKYRLTVDYPSDFRLFKNFVNNFGNKIYSVNMREIIKFLKKKPKLINYQKKIIRNEKLINDIEMDSI